ncbi:hypoxanthine phosphoribosyltransferase [Hydrogenoanaerobacterium saccharovorans]|uniref:Hypoxanthine phosphoribosyltransferase n=1 Tax=Hydrogenoanaerobacterium saccharovorans TaxID=474960 RepID=A0A1H8ARF6_9FIRM|nr:hypoxanthine phosphoribosyltransferase [Hydrogenoanaerobacterium saccharovorans]RPF47789.1 hypoxanthine phosphoribosyltransferase [Hydrogenoanaerobacterium saccharovorans]SEM73285.1 hypoxanthine phosphoribosyltransferase [Hydrogenoanaerobacterium saccharovorans]
MKDDILKVLITEEEIATKVKQLGKTISKDYEDKNLLLVSVLKGSVLFMADLMRAIDIHARVDFMSVSSYGSGVKTSGVVKIVKDLDINLAGYDVLIVEDILDSGLTLQYLKEVLLQRKPNSLKIATLLDKPERRMVDLKADYACFTVPDEFVVGYGLDFAEKYRNLPYVGVLKPEIYTK